MAINKAKVLENAQQYASQGKLKEAVTAFKKIYQVDPKDQTTLNMLGDLHVRLKKHPEALGYYTELADVYVSGGFLVRGIAMYKKISKLEPKNAHALERLAELYTMQGLMSEARSHFLQLAEALLKDNQTPKALEVMQKLLDLEPDNIKVQQRLADLYQRHDQTAEAAAIYRRMGDRLLHKDETEASLEWLAKAAELTPDDPELLLVHARALQRSGKPSEAIAALEKVPSVEENPEALEVLVAAKLDTGDAARATELAEKQFASDAKQFGPLLQIAQHAAASNDAARAIELLQRVSGAALENDPFNFLLAVRPVAEALPDSAEATALLLEAGRKTGDQSAQVEALQRQTQAAETAEDWEQAKQLYSEMIHLEPDNPDYMVKLNLVREKLGEDTSAEVAATEMGESTGFAGLSEDTDDETQTYLASTLADVDLFSNYGMPDKAIEKAREILQRLPLHIEANEKLLDLYVGSGNNQGVAEVAQRLSEILRNTGNEHRADELAEMAQRYAKKAGAAAATTPASETAEAVTSAETIAASTPDTDTGGTTELDLTEEWGTVLDEEVATEAPAEQPATFNAEEAKQEISFYLEQGLGDQAREALAGYERDFPEEPALAVLRTQVEAAGAPKAPAETEAPAEPQKEPAEAEQSFDLVLEEQPATGDSGAAASDFFSDLAGELDQTLAGRADLEEAGSDTGADLVSATPEPVPPPPPARELTEEEAGALADIFNEFKEELGEVEEVEDVETHYNLGIAYKEMGLHEEAISEFQKSVKAAEKQRDFRHVVQSCILLALCFRDKDMARVGVTWYERALKIPGLEDETALAIRYDLGEALEEAGERKRALECFMEVYGANVDYRDVGERIRELQES